MDGQPYFGPSQLPSSSSQRPSQVEPDHEGQIRIRQDEPVRRRVIFNRQLRENDPTAEPEAEVV